MMKNSLTKDLQNRLRKHLVDFKKSAEYLKTLSNNRDKRKQQENGKMTKEVLDLDFLGYKNMQDVMSVQSRFLCKNNVSILPVSLLL